MDLAKKQLTQVQQSKGVVSEAGLERLAKRLGLECLWEDDMGSDPKSRTLIVAGSALELLIILSNNIVQSVSLAFPDSPEIVTKHAEKAGKILLDDLMLLPGQSPLTKRLDKFAANFERLATLDKLSINPGLNLYEAVAGIYESLERLHQWDLRKIREDPALVGKGDEYLANMVLCTRNGTPVMHARNRVGLSLDYWKEKRLIPSSSESMASYMAKYEETWGMLISVALLGDMTIPPVRISDKWVSADDEKVSLGDDLQLGPPATLDWLQPDNTIIQAQDAAKVAADADSLKGNGEMMGPKLPEVMFMATLDPPLNVPLLIWQEIRQLGGDLEQPELVYTTLDSLMFPIPPGSQNDPSELRTISCIKEVEFKPPGGGEVSLKTHRNTLYIHKPVYGKTLKEIPFSHPQQLIAMLPFLRQYAFLSKVLDNSFGHKADTPDTPEPHPSSKSTTTTTATTTNQDNFGAFMAGSNKAAAKQVIGTVDSSPQPLSVDVTLSAHPVPRLQIVFPFRSATANVVLEVRPNGQLHVESQNVLDETNSTAPNGRQRRPEDIGKVLETLEHIGKWCEFIRSRWA